MRATVITILVCVGIFDILLIMCTSKLEKTRNGGTQEENNDWISEDGRRPAERWEDYVEVEYDVDGSISEEYLHGAIDVLDICKDMLHNEQDRMAMVNLIDKLERSKERL